MCYIIMYVRLCMMKLKPYYAESLLRSTEDANETIQSIETTLKLLDIEMPKCEAFTVEYKSVDNQILYNALNASDLLEKATEKLNSVLSNRGLPITAEHRHINERQRAVFARVFRVLWEQTLNTIDKDNFKSLIRSCASLSVWEDEPCVTRGLSYETVANEHTGTIAFMHCYGVTFVNYDKGQFKQRAWTVLHDTVQGAILRARKNIKLAERMLNVYDTP